MSVTLPESRCTVARRAIFELCVRDSERPSQYFYPRDQLRTYLTREKVAWILQCPCSNCRRQYMVFRRDHHAPTEFLDRIVGPENDVEASHNPARTAYSLFGLLIYIEHALLIIGFMMKEVYDVNISGESFSAESLKQVCDAFFREEGQHAFNSFERQFTIFLRHFAIPTMDSGTYSVYAKDRILPFFNQRKPSSQGAHSKVYAFEIYDEYRKFPHAGEVKMYARKELDKDSEVVFHMENRNLNLVTILKDPHIVKMIKPYKHGDTFNLIFEYAKANLDDVLRKPGSDLAEVGPSPVESRGEWSQLLGVAKALSKIGGPRGNQYLFGQTSRPEHLGVHFDLKPANILIDNNNIWMISDFGQATFKPTGDTSSRMVNQGGSLPYAPPEMDIDAKSSRRYDIWSLGCITLEVLAFTIHGTHGLNGCEAYQGLDEVRRTNNLTRGQEDTALWYQDDDKIYRVKPAVFEFMQFLLRAEPLQHRPSSLSFVNRIIDLITKMLEPVADDRIDIGEVVRLLEAAIEESNDQTQPLDMTPNDGEVPIGELELQCIRLWNFRRNDWKPAKLAVFEDARSNLRILRICTMVHHAAESDYLIRTRDQLVPAYAFFNPSASSNAEEAIYFSNIEPSGISKYPGSRFSFAEAKDIVTMQEVLTMQKIEANFPLMKIRYRRHKSFTEQLARFIQRQEDEEDGADLGVGWVQLWVEQTPSAPEARQDNLGIPTKPKRPVRMQPHQRADYKVVPPRRLVVYIHKLRAYITIPVDKNWYEDPDGTGVAPNTIRFVPRKPTRDPSFPASIFRPLHPQDRNPFPGIPLCPQTLRMLEQRSEVLFECTLLELTFEKDETKQLLSQKFTTVKNQWKAKTKELERQPGYTPVPPPLNQAISSSIPHIGGQEDKDRVKSPWPWSRNTKSGVSDSTAPRGNAGPEVAGGTNAGTPAPTAWRPEPYRGGGRGGAQSRKKPRATRPALELQPPVREEG